ncbi:MAG: Hpt domain-containing protein [Phreatobacter sp.]|uniref:Hpt domain-containing protein n=1 Tax=Phreatobacter sp. TaxID=1966341 RepID=UPI001A3EA22F|nr:Hpt domain-containing protein [Phreatobacter sp.]MBL8568252.1 Hpt domain-containing protein [Phreatobacter sp.]
MPKPKQPALDEASVQGFKDHEVITPTRNLKSYGRKAKIKVDEFGFDMEAIERAEAALADLAGEFDEWMAKEVERLTRARDAIAATGLNADTRSALYTAAHDIKGEAATFGYPLAARIADSLRQLLDGIEDDQAVPLGLVLQHVEAVRAIVREGAKGEDHPLAVAMADQLGAATSQKLIAITGAPSIAP